MGLRPAYPLAAVGLVRVKAVEDVAEVLATNGSRSHQQLRRGATGTTNLSIGQLVTAPILGLYQRAN